MLVTMVTPETFDTVSAIGWCYDYICKAGINISVSDMCQLLCRGQIC
jgi:hypothetical protein